jgi:hypothetical protein
MIGRRTIAGLSLLSALLFCAFAAQSALAVTGKAKATAVTCVKVSVVKTGDFNDAHCDEKNAEKKGEFTHEPFAGGVTSTVATATNEKVTEATTKSEPAVLDSTIGGTPVKITCPKVKNNPATSTIVNSEEGEAKTMRVGGFAETEFGTAGSKECTVGGITPCEVKEPIVSKANYEGTAGHTGPKGEASAMGLTFKGSGAEETFTEIEFIGATCPIKGTNLKVKGSVIGTSGPLTNSKNDNTWSGSTLAFTPEFAMENLKLGLVEAKFKTIITPTGPNGNPLAGTTF